MKILMVAPTPYFSDRGCHVRIFEEARALRALGHNVSICTYHLGRDQDGVPTYRTLRVPWYSKQSAGPSWHKPYLDILLFFSCIWLEICMKKIIFFTICCRTIGESHGWK